MRFCVPAMACCLPSRRQSDPTPPIIDVEEIIADFVWDKFKKSRPWQQLPCCLRRKDFVIDVPMNYFHFDKIMEDVRPRERLEPSLIPAQAHPSLASNMSHMPRGAAHSPVTAQSNVMALVTDFTNNTSNEQTYKFRFEKTRKASLSVTFQRGFTLGGKVNFSLGLPKVASGGGDVDMRLTVSKATGELIEETLTWEATSDIKVAESSNYTAKVLLSEIPVSYNFKMETKMTMPTGAAPVTIRRRRNHNSSNNHHNDSEFRYTDIVNNLKAVFQKHESKVRIVEEPVKSKTAVYSVVFKTTGIVEGVRLSSQKILLEGRPLLNMNNNPRGSGNLSLYGRGSSGGGVGGGGGGGGGVFNQFGRGSNIINDVSPAELMDVGGSSSGGGGHGGGDGYSSLPMARMIGPPVPSSSSSSSHPLPLPYPHPPPIPEETLDEDKAGEEEAERAGSAERECQSSFLNPAPPAARSNCRPMIGQVPRITTTPSSQASSPLSDAGSHASEGSKKSETVTTV